MKQNVLAVGLGFLALLVLLALLVAGLLLAPRAHTDRTAGSGYFNSVEQDWMRSAPTSPAGRR